MRLRAMKVYLGMLVGMMLAVVAWALFRVLLVPPLASPATLAGALLFVGLGTLASRKQVALGPSANHMMGTVAHIATIILFPLPIATLVIGSSKLITELSLLPLGQRKLKHVIVNTAATLLSNAAAGAAYTALGGNAYLFQHDLSALRAIPALAALVLLYIGVEAAVIVGAISLDKAGETPWSVFIALMRDMYKGEVSLTCVGVALGALCSFSPLACFFIVVPVWWSIEAFERAKLHRDETIRSVLQIAKSIDYIDTGTAEHSQRLAEMAEAVCKKLELMPEHTEEIVLASRVHDLGKIGISSSILLKEGPLTEDEREAMQKHPEIGADILAGYSAFARAVPIVKHHHERWDGKGYPDALRGDEIPIGSRVIAVVDAFDAMTMDRPYRNGMPIDVAVDRLKAAMGSQFDPKMCALFIQVLIERGLYEPPEPVRQLQVVPRTMHAG